MLDCERLEVGLSTRFVVRRAGLGRRGVVEHDQVIRTNQAEEFAETLVLQPAGFPIQVE